MRPTRVVVFWYLDSKSQLSLGEKSQNEKKVKRNFFSDDYQQKLFASRIRSSNDPRVSLDMEIVSNFSLI
jgi:hypothetical protein